MNQRSQSAAAPAEQTHRHLHRAYTVAQLCAALELNRRTFFRLRKKGQLPFLEELRPRLGRTVRYRADLVDRYLAGNWQSVSRHGRDSAAVLTTSQRNSLAVERADVRD